MKKTLFLFTLIFVLSISAFAGDDGHTPTGGGKTCPTGQTCLVGSQPTESKDSDTIFKNILTFLKTLFG